MSGKRTDLSVREKRDILKRYDGLKNCSQRKAASVLGISQPLLCRMLKDRRNIENHEQFNLPMTRKRKRPGKCVGVEDGLLRWFVQARTSSVPVTNATLFDRASSIAAQLGVNGFCPTDGWLSRWKSRNNVIIHRSFEDKKDVSATNDHSGNPALGPFSNPDVKSCSTRESIKSEGNINKQDVKDKHVLPTENETRAAIEILGKSIQRFGNEETFKLFYKLKANIENQMRDVYV